MLMKLVHFLQNRPPRRQSRVKRVIAVGKRYNLDLHGKHILIACDQGAIPLIQTNLKETGDDNDKAIIDKKTRKVRRPTHRYSGRRCCWTKLRAGPHSPG